MMKGRPPSTSSETIHRATRCGINGARRGRKHARRHAADMLRCRASVGFSLIELLVVISLIIILVALLVNALIENRGPIAATKTTMQTLHQVATEYQVNTGELPPALDPNTLDKDSIRVFVSAVQGVADCATMLDALGSEIFVSDDDDLNTARIIVDGWENPIVYRRYADPANRSTIDAPFEARGSVNNPQIFFASAGRDQKWGDRSASQTTDDFKWTRDNIVSFDLE